MENKKITFSDIPVGSYFITFPVDGDNSGHGGFMVKHNVFVKLDKIKAANIRTHTISTYPKVCQMKVVLLNL